MSSQHHPSRGSPIHHLGLTIRFAVRVLSILFIPSGWSGNPLPSAGALPSPESSPCLLYHHPLHPGYHHWVRYQVLVRARWFICIVMQVFRLLLFCCFSFASSLKRSKRARVLRAENRNFAYFCNLELDEWSHRLWSYRCKDFLCIIEKWVKRFLCPSCWRTLTRNVLSRYISITEPGFEGLKKYRPSFAQLQHQGISHREAFFCLLIINTRLSSIWTSSKRLISPFSRQARAMLFAFVLGFENQPSSHHQYYEAICIDQFSNKSFTVYFMLV